MSMDIGLVLAQFSATAKAASVIDGGSVCVVSKRARALMQIREPGQLQAS